MCVCDVVVGGGGGGGGGDGGGGEEAVRGVQNTSIPGAMF